MSQIFNSKVTDFLKNIFKEKVFAFFSIVVKKNAIKICLYNFFF